MRKLFAVAVLVGFGVVQNAFAMQANSDEGDVCYVACPGCKEILESGGDDKGGVDFGRLLDVLNGVESRLNSPKMLDLLKLFRGGKFKAIKKKIESEKISLNTKIHTVCYGDGMHGGPAEAHGCGFNRVLPQTLKLDGVEFIVGDNNLLGYCKAIKEDQKYRIYTCIEKIVYHNLQENAATALDFEDCGAEWHREMSMEFFDDKKSECDRKYLLRDGFCEKGFVCYKIWLMRKRNRSQNVMNKDEMREHDENYKHLNQMVADINSEGVLEFKRWRKSKKDVEHFIKWLKDNGATTSVSWE